MRHAVSKMNRIGRGLALFCGFVGCTDRDLIFEDRAIEALAGSYEQSADASADDLPVCADGVSLDGGCAPSRIDECGLACGEIPLDGTPTVCGNGRLGPPEECDDGNTQSLDGCSSVCRAEQCGNGRVDPGETCDRRDASCDASCQSVGSAGDACGNGTLDAPEECDDWNDASGDGCSAKCLLELCGNSRLDQSTTAFGEVLVETCDPPEPGFCDERCLLISCGDGRLAGDEECDDGNPAGGDGCDPACAIEFCGDGALNQLPGEEECEPAGEGACDDDCVTIACGNGALQGGEECDDGNGSAGDGCDPECRIEACGNGQLDALEDCEPPGGGDCDEQCSARRVECGDGVVDDGVGEECDDGNLAHGDGCSPGCLLEQCGNGRIEPPFETCEPPGTSACGQRCRTALCGDGWVDAAAGEECEDGNVESGDGCGPSCRFERCGNGVLEPGEHCEPPGTGACGRDCRIAGWTGEVAVTPLPVGADDFSLDSTNVPGSELGAGAGERGTRSFCVRTAPGARYEWRVTARAEEPALVRALLGARFFSRPDCEGAASSGVSTSYPLARADGSTLLTLPPPLPIPGEEASFEAPAAASSLQLWVGVEADAPSRLTLMQIELVHFGPERCGDGFPEGDEQCEPSVTSACEGDCRLALECGDGIAAPGECGGGRCPGDCGAEPAECGDGVVIAPEECEPPGADGCKASCTLERTLCGDGRVEADESCDPPDGARCDDECRTIQCGDGVVDAPEECDPPGDGCSRNCRESASEPSTCGDGFLQGDEECDPPNPLTWCSPRCERRDPLGACGNGEVDAELGEECDPPGFEEDCGGDCRTTVCGDEKVDGRELCDPPDGATCGPECQPLGEALECQECLAESCRGDGPTGDPDPFLACFGMEGAAEGGASEGTPRRQLCVDAVECMRETGCAAETRSAYAPTPAACYCGKGVLTPAPEGQNRLRRCRDGAAPPEGACREAFARAAESELPSVVLAALDPLFSDSALSAAVRLMTACGHDEDGCGEECSVQSQCGNGVLEPGELCDPGLDPYCVDDVCAVLPCGNGRVDVEWPYGADGEDPELADYEAPEDWVAETCDVTDPYTNQDGRCDNTCQLIVTCGDGTLVPSVEACDPGEDGDWSECCQPDNGEQLSSCDRNGNQRLDRNEQCQAPSVCGNGRREGVEECDPEVPDPARCVDCRAVDPCTECTRRQCTSQHEFCYGSAVEPRTRNGCGEVLDCIADSHCARDGDYATCRCGTTDLVTCAQLGGDGPCEEVIARNTLCPTRAGAVDESCVTASALMTTVPTGAALQIVNCRKFFCAAECDYKPYDTGVDE
jgi:cysteine-rich repeat protein